MSNAFLPTEQQSGVPYQVHYLANALVERGHEVTVYSFSPPPSDARYEAVAFPKPKLPPRFFPYYMALHLASTDFSKFDVVHAHGDNYLCFRRKPPLLRTFHGSAIDECANATTFRRRAFQYFNIPLEGLGARVATAAVGVSRATAARISRIRTIVSCGVDITAFSPGAKRDRPTVLFVGSEEGRKRGRWLAELFVREILPRVPTAELQMVTELAGASEIPGIRRLGRVSPEDLRRLYREAWVFVLPSTYEGFGVPYIEAMASGTAVVATTGNPGAEEVLEGGRYGTLVTDGEIGAAIVELLTNPSLRAAQQERGLERCQTFAWPTIAREYEEIYARMIGTAPRVG